ncbi:MAG: nucleotidyl transferase AbiEii/AbiGii toxin family protein [Candidatus Aminicenantes bacterium]
MNEMRPLHNRLLEARNRLGIPWNVLEHDYLLSWILAGISEIDTLYNTFAFKGGTALKKCYFGDYRFSENLDFSGVNNVPTGEGMERAIHEACKAAMNLLNEYAPVEIFCRRYVERDPHPGGQEAFLINARLPWQNRPHTRVMIEISIDEDVLKPLNNRSVIHEYGEPFNVQVRVYALEEIIAEKLRAILQHIKILQERGWSRSRARDYYDLWRILREYPAHLNFSEFASFLREKCSIGNVSFDSPNDFFNEPMLYYVKKTWNQLLGPLVPDLPAFEEVINELKPQIEDLLPVC